MKKSLLILALVACTSAFAQYGREDRDHRDGVQRDWNESRDQRQIRIPDRMERHIERRGNSRVLVTTTWTCVRGRYRCYEWRKHVAVTVLPRRPYRRYE